VSARVLRAADYRRVRWKNGGGWTTELAAAPVAADGFDWRVSIAEVDSDGPFSTFPGCDRHIALLDGVGMRIDIEGAESLLLEQRLRFHRFAGEASASGRLVSGPVRDFNVIVRRAAVEAEVLHRPLVGPMVFLADPAVSWFVYVAAGQAELKGAADAALGNGDSLLLEPDTRNRVVSGGGELVIVKLSGSAPQA
jgi:environmental stress-induced protein Ves